MGTTIHVEVWHEDVAIAEQAAAVVLHVQRMKLINFGSEDVPVFTFNYPIDFYPV
jgi:hypothetical protein